jgi:short-subunit dehydrogenase
MKPFDKQRFTLITGAGRGLGKALAWECAGRQQNLILVALPGEGLHQLAADIRTAHNVVIFSFELDLCEEGQCEALWQSVYEKGVQVNILINNAGVGGTDFFGAGHIRHYQQQIKLNVLATTTITHLFMDMLKQNSPAYILNVGSLAVFFSLPKKQVYGATKSFISYFSRSLRREVKPYGVFVSVVCPGGMYTNAVARHAISTGPYLCQVAAMDPEAVAPIAMNGLLHQKALIIPGRINQALVLLNRLLPAFIVRYFEAHAMRRMQAPPALPVPQPLYASVHRHKETCLSKS